MNPTLNDIPLALSQGVYSTEVLKQALQLEGDDQLRLFEIARLLRSKSFPDNTVQVRSVIEISNICRQKCKYCIIGANDQKVNYSLNREEIFTLMDYLFQKGRRTILLQSGENLNSDFVNDVAEAIEQIKQRHAELRIILCMGDMSREVYQRLYNAGASDYILKFETSNSALFSYCKPNDTLQNRLECIKNLAEIGFRVGSGNIVGLPGQTLDDLVNDLLLIHKLPLAMNSTTIFIPAEKSVFENEPAGNAVYTLNMMALMRIMNPYRYMPTTSSLEKMITDGQYLGLMAGANTVTIHDGTPEDLKDLFPIYSTKRVRPQKDHFVDIVSRAGFNTLNLI
ncbi:MAG: radical SAM protein [Lachnospira sp.]